MKKIAVFHFLPLEFYPPVTNFLDYAGSKENLIIKVFSTSNDKERKEYKNDRLAGIKRVSIPNSGDKTFTKLSKYIKFNFFFLRDLLKFKPDEILYFESYSAGPVYWYIKFFRKKTKLRIHYHEYASPEWYENGMRLVKYYHKLERQYLYSRANWISQTNEERINLFLKDNPQVNPKKMRVLPNYPPKSWIKDEVEMKKIESPVKTVYIGSLSLENTFLEEYCTWVIEQRGKVTFDIYSYNLHETTRHYLNSLNSRFVNFIPGGVEYENIPEVLKNYQVGVILYKPVNENYINNAPNKLFEYLLCGLEVWFPDTMKGCLSYQRSVSPKVIPVDFCNLHIENFLESNRKTASYSNNDSVFTAEKALHPLVKELIE